MMGMVEKPISAEPDIVPALRIFSYIWLGLMVASFLSNWLINGLDDVEWLRRLLSLGYALIWAGYLSITKLRWYLGEKYLPIALGIAVIGSLAVQFILFQQFTQATEGDFLNFVLILVRLFLLWVVVALIIGWKYQLRYVMLFAVSMGASFLLWGIFADDNTPAVIEQLLVVSVSNVVALGIVGYLVWRLSQAEQSQRRQLSAANAKLRQQTITLEELTISRERNRLARELHDTLAHSLSGLTVQIEAVRTLWQHNPETAETMLARADEMARTGLTEVRRALQALRASPLQDLGLGLALYTLGEQAAERAGTQLQIDMPTHMAAQLEPHIEQGVYRIAQEALENIIRHGEAKTISMELFQDTSGLRMVITDDGLGFNPEDAQHLGHYGLQGMKEHAALIGGTLEINSMPGQGTAIELKVMRN